MAQIAKVAKECGIYDSSLGNWVRQAREQAEGGPTVEERAEIEATEFVTFDSGDHHRDA